MRGVSTLILVWVSSLALSNTQRPPKDAFDIPTNPTMNFRCPMHEPDRLWPSLYMTLRQSIAKLREGRLDEVKLPLAEAIRTATADLPRAFNCSIGISAAWRVLAASYAHNGDLQRTDPLAYRRANQVGLRFMHVAMNWLTHAFVKPGQNNGYWVDEADWPLTIQDMNDAQTSIQRVIESYGPYGHPPTWAAVPTDFRDPSISIAIVTMCDYPPDNVLPRYSISNNDIYAGKHGYSVIMENKRMDESRPHAWAKISLLEKHVAKAEHDWLLWFDCDTYFMNTNVTLDHLLYKYGSVRGADGQRYLDPNFHMLIQEDHAMLNTGVFFIRTSPWALDLLQRIYGGPDSPWIDHPWWENAAFSHEFLGQADRAIALASERHSDFIRTNADMDGLYPPFVRVAPQFEFNSYHPITSRLYQHDTWEEGKFVLAFSGCTQGSSPTVMQLVYGNYYRVFCELNNVQDQCIPVQDPPIFPWTQEVKEKKTKKKKRKAATAEAA